MRFLFFFFGIWTKFSRPLFTTSKQPSYGQHLSIPLSLTEIIGTSIESDEIWVQIITALTPICKFFWDPICKMLTAIPKADMNPKMHNKASQLGLLFRHVVGNRSVSPSSRASSRSQSSNPSKLIHSCQFYLLVLGVDMILSLQNSSVLFKN